jgi:hypothetical protein
MQAGRSARQASMKRWLASFQTCSVQADVAASIQRRTCTEGSLAL